MALTGRAEFRDHHQYSRYDIEALARKALEVGSVTLVTTSKDAVRDLGCAQSAAQGLKPRRRATAHFDRGFVRTMAARPALKARAA